MNKEQEVMHALGHHVWVYLLWDQTKLGIGMTDGDFKCYHTAPPWIQEYHPFRICMICSKVEVARRKGDWAEVGVTSSYSKAWHVHIQLLSREFYEQNK